MARPVDLRRLSGAMARRAAASAGQLVNLSSLSGPRSPRPAEGGRLVVLPPPYEPPYEPQYDTGYHRADDTGYEPAADAWVDRDQATQLATAEATGLMQPMEVVPPRTRPAPPGQMSPTVTRVLAGLALIVAYVAICLSPLVIISLGSQAPRRPYLIELSVALGYVGLAMMVLQFALVSRIRWLSAPFGIDILQRFHRQVSFVALAFVLAHPALLLAQSLPTYLPLFDVRTSPWRARYAVASVAALLLVVFGSVWRRKLHIPYEFWRVSHRFLSIAVVFLALAHMLGVNRFTGQPGGRAVLGLVTVGILSVVVWSRVIAPRRRHFTPWRVVEVVPERGRAMTMIVEPDQHEGWSFLPGQFAWVTVGRSPFSVRQHPFSLSSPADADPGGRVAVTIKELGDWTKNVGRIKRGTRVYLDGPHGSFSIDLKQAPGYVLVAAGVGITPMYSMISTMCLREDTRPVILFYSNTDWESITFRDQLQELEGYMANLTVVHLLKRWPPGWEGESNRVTADVLRRHLPRQYRSFEFFICGSETMMSATETALAELGVDGYRIHSERFGMV
jgi:predicted ferric reductase